MILMGESILQGPIEQTVRFLWIRKMAHRKAVTQKPDDLNPIDGTHGKGGK